MLLSLLLITSTLSAQTKWELAKDKNNIKVYTAIEGTSRFKTIKVEATVSGTIPKLVSIIKDINGNKNWVYNTKQSYVIKRISSNEVLYYLETELPWPVDNRDIAIRSKLNVDSINNILKLVAVAEPGAIPEKKGLVRIKVFNALWNVYAISNNQIVINYVLRMEPGGSVPASVTNMFISKGPYQTFNNLAQLLKK